MRLFGRKTPAQHRDLRPFSPDGQYRTRDHIESLLEDEMSRLGMRAAGDLTWCSEWADGARRVISLFLLKGDSAVFEWGYNFDFLPEIHSGRIRYFRTEKSIHAQLRQLPREFADMADWSTYSLPMHSSDLPSLEAEILRIWHNTEPQITEWFSRITLEKDMRAELERQISRGKYYRLLLPEQKYVLAFLTARSGDISGAESLLTATNTFLIASPGIQTKLLARLNDTHTDQTAYE